MNVRRDEPGFAWALVAGLAGAIALERLRLLDQPLERDLATYAVVGHEMLRGRLLYSDLWDHKPPGVYAVYAAFETLFGYGEAQVFWLGVAASVATLVGVFVCGRASGSARRGLWAAAAWTVLQSWAWLQADMPNTEVFINAAVVWAFALLLSRGGPEPGWARLVLAGALLASGSLFKHVVLVAALLLGVLPALLSRPRRAFLQATAVVAPVLLTWGALAGAFAARGRFEAFHEAVIAFNRSYAGPLLRNLIVPPEGVPGADGRLFLLSLAGGIAALACVPFALRARSRNGLLLAALGLSAHVMAALPGNAFPHYFQYWLPALALLSGWAAEIPAPGARLQPALPVGLLLAVGAARLAGDARVPADELSRRKYGDVFVSGKELALLVGDVLRPDETVWQFGDEPGLYFYCRKSPPTGVLAARNLVLGPGAERRARETLEALERARPDLVVLNLDPAFPREARTGAWIDAEYVPLRLPAEFPGFALRALRGSALERRLGGGSGGRS